MLVNIDKLTTLSHTQCLFLSHVMVWMSTINRTCYKYLKHWYVFLFYLVTVSYYDTVFAYFLLQSGSPSILNMVCALGFFTVLWEHRCHLMYSTNFMRCTCSILKVYWNFYVVCIYFLVDEWNITLFLKISYTCIFISIYVGQTGKYILSRTKNTMHKCITSLVL